MGVLEVVVNCLPQAAVVFILYTFVLVIYRLFFHPLAAIPGPRLASATYLYEWYYDLWLGGQYHFKLKELHKAYGLLLCLNPDGVHINDPHYFDEVFNHSNGRTDKTYKMANVFGPYDAKLCFHLESTKGKLFDLKNAYNALSWDVIHEYCFSRDSEMVIQSDFGREMFDNIEASLPIVLWNVHIPLILRLVKLIPDSTSKFLGPALADIHKTRREISEQIEAVRHGHDTAYETSGHRTIIHELLESDLPPQEKAKNRLRDEGFNLVNAGTRSCLGINLAMTELYLTIGMLFRRFSFDVSAVDRERDIDVSRDFVLVANRFDSRGVFVRVGSVEE